MKITTHEGQTWQVVSEPKIKSYTHYKAGHMWRYLNNKLTAHEEYTITSWFVDAIFISNHEDRVRTLVFTEREYQEFMLNAVDL